MTDWEKQRTPVLRSQGESYNAIAAALNVSVNSIKTFCRRNHLTSARVKDNLSAVSPPIDLIDNKNRGNTVNAETQTNVVNKAVSASQTACSVKLVFAENPDENAIQDVLGMLISSRFRREQNI